MVDILPPTHLKSPPPRRRSSEVFRPKHAERTKNQDVHIHRPESEPLTATSAVHMAQALESRKTQGEKPVDILTAFTDGKLDQETALANWKEEHRLQALNLDEDTRYILARDALIREWQKHNPQPQEASSQKDWELQYEKQLKEAGYAALRKFTRENFPDYQRYERYGLYLDSSGSVSADSDPLVHRTEKEIHDAAYREFPHHKATHLKKWRVVNAKVSNRFWDSFIERYPEKARFYAQSHTGISTALHRAQRK